MDFTYTKIRDFIYQFRDPQGVCFTLIKGSKISLVIDCGYGILNTKKLIEQFVSTPYRVVLTHGHMDHSSGAYLFDEVSISLEDYELLKKHNSVQMRTNNIKTAIEKNIINEDFDIESYINKPLPKITFIKENDIIDLGNMHIKVVKMNGHTKGSLGFLIEESAILFTGDSAITNVWMFLKESTSIKEYIEMLKKVKKLNFNTFITGHLMTEFDKKYFDYYIEVAENAKIEKSIKVSFKGFELPNVYQYQQKFNDELIGICYQEPKES